MNPYKAYQQKQAVGQTRIDIILSLYETLIERLQKTLTSLRQGNEAEVRKQLAACNLGLAGLASAVEGQGGEVASNFLRLYGFVARRLEEADESSILAALNVLRTLHGAFAEIRTQAVAMERSGEIPALDRLPSFQANA
jgi:flagellin-specific chaperone FliS